MVGMLGNLENVMRKGMFTPLTADSGIRKPCSQSVV